MASLIYLDNSNLLIEGIKQKKMELGKKFTPHQIHYGRLHDLLSLNEDPVIANAYVSERYTTDGLAAHWKSVLGASKWKVIQKARSKESNQEKMIDTQITTDIIFDCLEVMDPDKDQIILVAGDRDYVPVVQALSERGYPVMVAFWGALTSRLLRSEAALFFDLTCEMDNLLLPVQKVCEQSRKVKKSAKAGRKKRELLEQARMLDSYLLTRSEIDQCHEAR